MPGIKFQWGKGNAVEFGVTKLPNRRSPALYRARGANIDILAYFRSEEAANTFNELLNSVVEGFESSNRARIRKR